MIAYPASAKISAVGEAIRSTGKVLTTSLTLPIVAAGTAATKTFTDFDDAMRQVQATMGLTGENGAGDIVKLTEAAKEMGATTRYTASQAAEALNYLAPGRIQCGQSHSRIAQRAAVGPGGKHRSGTRYGHGHRQHERLGHRHKSAQRFRG